MWQNPVEPIRLPEDIILQRPRRTSQYLANATMLGRSTLLLILAGSCYAEKNTILKLRMFSYQALSASFRVYPLGRPLLIQTGRPLYPGVVGPPQV